MKLKTAEVAGKTYAEVQDGKPVYVGEDGKEVAFDAPYTVATIKRLNDEAKGYREAKEAHEARLKAFEGIEDPDGARKALETVKNLSSGDMVKAEKVEEIKREAAKATEERLQAAAEANARKLKEITAAHDKLQAEYFGEKVGGSFSRSKFIQEKIAVPADLIQDKFGRNFKVEEGRTVGYDASGNKLYSRAKPGDLAEFDEALEMLVESYPHRDAILKGSGSTGSGAIHSNGGRGGPDLSGLSPAARMTAARAAAARPR